MATVRSMVEPRGNTGNHSDIFLYICTSNRLVRDFFCADVCGEIQHAYNEAHGIVPKTVIKSVRDLIEISSPTAERKGRSGVKMTKAEKEKEIARLEKQMKEAARMMEYEYAALLRDQIIELRGNGL